MKKHNILIALGVLLLTGYNVIVYFQENTTQDNLKVVGSRDFSGIEDLELIGTMHSIQEVHNKWQGYGGIGIIRINIIESNINEYDPREKQANYYCIIKDGKAEIYGWWPADVRKGDTLKLDVRKRTMIYPKEDGGNFEINDIWIPAVGFFKYIKKKSGNVPDSVDF